MASEGFCCQSYLMLVVSCTLARISQCGGSVSWRLSHAKERGAGRWGVLKWLLVPFNEFPLDPLAKGKCCLYSLCNCTMIQYVWENMQACSGVMHGVVPYVEYTLYIVKYICKSSRCPLSVVRCHAALQVPLKFLQSRH